MNKSRIIRLSFLLSVIALAYTLYWQAAQPPEVPAKRFAVIKDMDGRELVRLPLKADKTFEK